MTQLFNAHAEGRAEFFVTSGARRLLTSFAYYKAAQEVVDAHNRLGPRSNLLSLKLDSGAYTAWTKGTPVDVDAYSEWVRTIDAALPGVDVTAVNLDVIPGSFGNTATPGERAAAMKASVKNADRLRAAGVTPIEVFHQNEPFEYLDELLARLPSGGVVAISPRNDVSTKRKMLWMDEAYERLTSDWPRIVKTHILGTTTGHVVQRYPAWSADSCQWSYFEQYGIRIHPRYRTHYFADDKVSGRVVSGRKDNIAQTVDLIWREEQGLAKLWKRRGVEWL